MLNRDIIEARYYEIEDLDCLIKHLIVTKAMLS